MTKFIDKQKDLIVSHNYVGRTVNTVGHSTYGAFANTTSPGHMKPVNPHLKIKFDPTPNKRSNRKKMVHLDDLDYLNIINAARGDGFDFYTGKVKLSTSGRLTKSFLTESFPESKFHYTVKNNPFVGILSQGSCFIGAKKVPYDLYSVQNLYSDVIHPHVMDNILASQDPKPEKIAGFWDSPGVEPDIWIESWTETIKGCAGNY